MDNRLLKKVTTGRLSSEHWTIVFSEIDAVTTDSRASTGGMGKPLVGLVNTVKYQVRLGLVRFG